jgi:putative SOS response-associated peptidase YedK
VLAAPSAELRSRLEQASHSADAGRHPFDRRQACGENDAMGLAAYWAKDEKLSYSTFNVRAEEFTKKPAFRDAWRRGQRCLVITDGFYEWKRLDANCKETALRNRHGR